MDITTMWSALKSERAAGRVRGTIAILAALGTVWALGQSLYDVYCWFTNFQFELDYGMYTNMMWNTAHGRPYDAINSHSYLETHLAFTIGPLGLAYRLWDHPFVAGVLQWLALAGGAGVFLVMARRHRLPEDHAAAFLFFFVAHPYLQSTLLHAFHTVAFYPLLFPLLCYAMLLRKGLAWIPVLAIMGVREDAAFYVVPMLLYQAVRDRWAGGYWLAGFAAAYGAFACTALYPLINGASLLKRRQLGIDHIVGRILEVPLWSRIKPQIWVGVFILPVLRTGWKPCLAFLAFGLPVTMFSPQAKQYAMTWHYGAPVIALLACGVYYGLAEAAREGRGGPWAKAAVSSLLVVFAVAAHVQAGYLPGGGLREKAARRVGAHGRMALAAAARIPREGVLLTDLRLTPFVANRADLMIWNNKIWNQVFTPGDEVTLVFFRRARTPEKTAPADVHEWLRNGTFGVLWWDGFFGILERGHDVRMNKEVLSELFEPRRLMFADFAGHGSSDQFDEAEAPRLSRHWRGQVRESPPVIAYGRDIRLPAGRHVAEFRFRPGRTNPSTGHGRGMLGLHRRPDGSLIAERSIAESAPGVTTVQVIEFELKEEGRVEPRVTGGDTELWLESVTFTAPARAAGAPAAGPKKPGG